MGTPAVNTTVPSPVYCQQCGAKVNAADMFCNKCGSPTSKVSRPVAVPAKGASSELEFERNLKVAWSCLKDVEHKVDDIRGAKQASDKEVNEGTFRGTMAATALQGRLEREFQEGLDMACKAAAKAAEIDPNGYVEIQGSYVSPKVVFAGVCGLRGDLRFAFDKWDEAIALYNQALQYVPDDPSCYYNIGASYTNKHEPAQATHAFQKVVELDPTGHFGIEAAKILHKLESGSVGKKGFTGSFKIVAVLGGLTLVSFFMMGQNPGAGFANLVIWGGSLTLYCWVKYK